MKRRYLILPFNAAALWAAIDFADCGKSTTSGAHPIAMAVIGFCSSVAFLLLVSAIHDAGGFR